MTIQMVFVLLVVALSIYALVRNSMRQGLVLLSSASLLYVAGIIDADELLKGFSNRGVITIALLFLVAEGVKRSGAIDGFVRRIFPEDRSKVRSLQRRLLPCVAFISSFINNTPVVIIVAPILKQWASKMRISASKYLIPLSYATILGGMCSLIGSSTNLVVHGMMIAEGYEGFSMYELARVGVFIAVAGLLYLILFSTYLLPKRGNASSEEEIERSNYTQVIISPRFPGINRRVGEYNFHRQFGARVVAIKRAGEIIKGSLRDVVYQKNDTLVLETEEGFMQTWGSSSFFALFITTGEKQESPSAKKRWGAITLLVFMCGGAVIGERPFMQEIFPNIRLDMFFFALVTAVLMAWAQLYPPKSYTKYISWDLLITIASAFAVSGAIQNSGVVDLVISYIVGLAGEAGANPYILLAILFVLTNILTELVTNNAAAAISFPIAISISTQLGVNHMPFFVAICIAASSSFCTPIGYQTNLIVQSIGNYKYLDFLRVGLPLNIITFVLSIILIPLIWPF